MELSRLFRMCRVIADSEPIFSVHVEAVPFTRFPLLFVHFSPLRMLSPTTFNLSSRLVIWVLLSEIFFLIRRFAWPFFRNRHNWLSFSHMAHGISFRCGRSSLSVLILIQQFCRLRPVRWPRECLLLLPPQNR